MRALVLPLLLTTVITACAEESEDDLDGAIDLSGKADAPSFRGTYQLPGSGVRKGDLTNLSLDNDGTYVRVRCYTTNCTKTVPESDHYRVFESPTTHKRYIAFESFAWTDFDNRESKQVTVDTYEVRKNGANLELRKTYTSRWFTLEARTDEQLCTATMGTWDAQTDHNGAAAGTTTHCDCGQDAGTWPSPAFVPGAGGCHMTPAAGEDACDESQGSYTDDDSDALGDYCMCPSGTQLTDAGCTALSAR